MKRALAALLLAGSVLLPVLAQDVPAPGSAADPLAAYYGNTLLSEKLSNISPYGGAAHVWLYPDRHFVSFDATTGGRFGKYSLAGKPGNWTLCMGYSFRTICYPIDAHKPGDVWIVRDPDALSLNSLVTGHQ